MQHLRLDREEGILVTTLSRGKANALNCDLVNELQQALNHAIGDDRTQGVVLTSESPKVFCGGFDVQEVFAYDRQRMTEYIKRFTRLFDTLRHLPKPTVAAISGHSYGGGAMLAMACDLRIMSEGDACFALNEVNLGAVLPERMIRAMADVVPGPTARKLFLEGHVYKAADALRAGIVEELVPVGNIRHRALTLARQLASKPRKAFAAHKAALVHGNGGPAFSPDEMDAMAEAFTAVWFSDECRGHRDALVARLAAS